MLFHCSNSCYSLESSLALTYSCPLHPPPPLVPSFLVKTTISWPQFKCRHDSWRCQLMLFSFPLLALSPSLSGDRSTQRGAWYDRFRCHLAATWPSATPTPHAFLLLLSSERSQPLSQTLSGDLFRCRHDRCRCYSVSVSVLWPHGSLQWATWQVWMLPTGGPQPCSLPTNLPSSIILSPSSLLRSSFILHLFVTFFLCSQCVFIHSSLTLGMHFTSEPDLWALLRAKFFFSYFVDTWGI